MNDICKCKKRCATKSCHVGEKISLVAAAGAMLEEAAAILSQIAHLTMSSMY